MDRSRYLDLLQLDGRLLGDAASRDLDAPVPTCPGWTVRDAVDHVAEVYEHKIASIALGGTRPDPWPPHRDHADRWDEAADPLRWFADAHDRLLAVLSRTDPAAPSWTWWPPDQTAGFWVRRMAHETAMHRVDVQAAFGRPTPVDVELAIDGIDEVLTMMLADDWSTLPQPGSTGTVIVETASERWLVTMTPDLVTTEPVPANATAETHVSGDPGSVLLWLWGRAPDSAIVASGPDDGVHRLRDRLAKATQ